MSLDPWNLVGWMVVGTVAGIALAAVARAIGDSFSESMSTPWGRKLMAINLGLAILLGLYLWAPRWTLVLVVIITTAFVVLWASWRKRPSTSEGGAP